MVPRLPGHGAVPHIYDTATRQLVEARPIAVAGLYVCGITPYDATHIGHAATYLAYDILIRLWLDAGYDVRYVQNTTDVDDPLLERAAATASTGAPWPRSRPTCSVATWSASASSRPTTTSRRPR